MLNLKAYLPSMEDFDSLPDTLRDDVSTDGENSYVAGIPEELIKPMDNSEQSNEDDGVITNMLQKQKNAEDTEEAYEETEEKKFEEEHPKEDDSADSSEVDLGGGDQDAGTDEPVEGDDADASAGDDAPSGNDQELLDGEEPSEDDEEEEAVTDVQYAVECYTELLRNSGKNLTHQSAAFMAVGLQRIQKQLGLNTVSTESFVEGPSAGRYTLSAEGIGEKLKEAGKAAWAKILELWKKLKGWFSKLFQGVEQKKEENVYLLKVLSAVEAGPEAVEKVPEPPESPARKPFKAGEAIKRFKKNKAAMARAKEWKEQQEKDNKPSPEVEAKTYSTVPRVLFMIGENNELSFDGTGEIEVLDYIEKSWIPAIERLYGACASIVSAQKPQEITEGFLKVLDSSILSEYKTPTIQTAGNSTFNPVEDLLGWAIRNTTDGDGTSAKLGIKPNDPNAVVAGKANEKVLARLETLKPVASKIEDYIAKFEELVNKLKGNDEAMSAIARVSRVCNIYDIARTLSYIENRVKTRIHFMDLVAAATIQHNTP
ncbi:hypothetical protein [Pseudomonas phage D6]|nr:hypothetical protein [Pseudomonas phage D6]